MFPDSVVCGLIRCSHRRGAEFKAKNIRTQHRPYEARESPSQLKHASGYSHQSAATADTSSDRTSVGTTNGHTETSLTPLDPQNQAYNLYGISAQFWDYQCPSHATIIGTYQRTWSCSYHESVLQTEDLSPHVAVAADEQHTLRGYMNGDPSQQYALYCQSDSGRLSIDKGCQCVRTCVSAGLDWLEWREVFGH
jgi:hypothetical protein